MEPPPFGFVSNAEWLPPEPRFVSYADGLYAEGGVEGRREASGGDEPTRDASPMMRRSGGGSSTASEDG